MCVCVYVYVCTLLIHFTVIVYGLGFSLYQTADASVSVFPHHNNDVAFLIQFSSLSSKYLYSKVNPSFLR